MSLTTNILVGIAATLQGSNDLGTPVFPLSKKDETALANGTGSSQADLLFADQRTIAASDNEDLDLAGSLTDPLGSTLTFAAVKAIYIKAAAGNTNDVQVSPASSNGFLGPFADASDQIDLPPGGALLLTAPADGWTVTGGTGDLLNVANSGAGTSVTYDIVVVGTSS
jgi:hypothetical protein